MHCILSTILFFFFFFLNRHIISSNRCMFRYRIIIRLQSFVSTTKKYCCRIWNATCCRITCPCWRGSIPVKFSFYHCLKVTPFVYIKECNVTFPAQKKIQLHIWQVAPFLWKHQFLRWKGSTGARLNRWDRLQSPLWAIVVLRHSN